MDGEKRVQLKQLLTEKLMTDERKNEILEILAGFVQNFIENDNESISLEKMESRGFLSEEEMENLIDDHPWLLPYRFFLESDYVIEDDDLMKLSEQLNDINLEESAKKLIEKLTSNQETRINLFKLGTTLMEHVHVFCRTYPSIKSLCSTDWLRVKEQMRDSSWTYDEKQWVNELWCSTPLRREISEKQLPLELANDLERIDVKELRDLSEEDFLEFSRDFTANEKRIFKNWYCKEKENICEDQQVKISITSADSTSNMNIILLTDEVRSKMEEQVIMVDVEKSMTESQIFLNEDPILFDEEDDHIDVQQQPPGCNPEDDNFQNMDEINKFDEFLNSVPDGIHPCETDQELIANLSEGSTLHGFCYGIDAAELCKKAPIVVLKKLDFPAIRKELPAASFLFSEYFSNSRDETQIIKAISETGYSFASRMNAKGISYKSDNSSNLYNVGDSSLSDKTQRNKMTMTKFHICPVGFSYTCDTNQLVLSESAMESLQNVKNDAKAKKFLQNYGSHVFCGVNYLGGILSHSVEIETSSQQVDCERLKLIASDKITQATSLASDKSHTFVADAFEASCRFKIDNFYGPDEKELEPFEERLRANSRLWRIIDREDLPETLIPVWNVIYNNHPNMKDEADMLCGAWLELAAKPDLLFYREQERLKMEERQANIELRQNQSRKVKRIESVLVDKTQFSYFDPKTILGSLHQVKIKLIRYRL